jgi:hypothetical protein
MPFGDEEIQQAASTVDAADAVNKQNNTLDLFHGRVREVLLNDDGQSSGRIDVLIAETRDAYEKNKYDKVVAFPLDIYNFTLPVVNESVIIIKGESGRYYYLSIPPVNFYDQITVDNEDLVGGDGEENVKINLHNYDSFVVDDGNDTQVYGTTLTEDFIAATDIVKSRNVNEGDNLIQGRYGSSIKFTSKNELNATPWSLEGEDGQPVIAIRCGQEQLEDPTTDNSFIYLLSDQSFDFGDIEFSPESGNVGETMDAYVGGQVIIGADRLTLLSKADDISISSKSLVSISTAKWAVDMDVLMDQVKALATQLDALCAGKATLVTGVGPTGVGTNTADCAAIKSEIEGMEQ